MSQNAVRQLMPEGTETEAKNELAWRTAAENLKLKLWRTNDGRKICQCKGGHYLWGWGNGRFAYTTNSILVATAAQMQVAMQLVEQGVFRNEA